MSISSQIKRCIEQGQLNEAVVKMQRLQKRLQQNAEMQCNQEETLKQLDAKLAAQCQNLKPIERIVQQIEQRQNEESQAQ